MKRYFAKSEFSRNVVTLLTGTIVAQALPIAIAPILTRIYTPADFGVFALYMAIATIASVFATGRYELAVMLPENEEDAVNLVALSIFITLTLAFLSLLSILIFNQQIVKILGNPKIDNWIYFIPLAVLLTGIYQTLYYWNNRNKKYRLLAISRVAQNGTISITQTLLGYITYMGGLILGDNIGKIFATSILAKLTWNADKEKLKFITKYKIISLAKKYRKFPIYDAMASLANILSYQVQNLLFPIFYGITSSGNYFLVFRVLQAPLSLISSTVVDVYKQKLASKNVTDTEFKILYKKMFLFCFLLGIVPFAILTYSAVDLFIFVFGKEWKEAGEYASILAPMFFIRFIANPLSYFIYIKDKQEFNIIAHSLLLVFSLLAFYFSNSAFDMVMIISVSFSLIYLLYIFYTAKLVNIL